MIDLHGVGKLAVVGEVEESRDSGLNCCPELSVEILAAEQLCDLRGDTLKCFRGLGIIACRLDLLLDQLGELVERRCRLQRLSRIFRHLNSVEQVGYCCRLFAAVLPAKLVRARPHLDPARIGRSLARAIAPIYRLFNPND